MIEHDCYKPAKALEINLTHRLATLERDTKFIAAKRIVTGYTLTKKGDEMLLIVRAVGKQKHYVAFFYGDCAGCCWVNFANGFRSGRIDWKKDKFART